jgi:hypothetical protein
MRRRRRDPPVDNVAAMVRLWTTICHPQDDAEGCAPPLSVTEPRVRPQNGMKPRIQCVLTQWNPGFIAFRPGRGWVGLEVVEAGYFFGG